MVDCSVHSPRGAPCSRVAGRHCSHALPAASPRDQECSRCDNRRSRKPHTFHRPDLPPPSRRRRCCNHFPHTSRHRHRHTGPPGRSCSLCNWHRRLRYRCSFRSPRLRCSSHRRRNNLRTHHFLFGRSCNHHESDGADNLWFRPTKQPESRSSINDSLPNSFPSIPPPPWRQLVFLPWILQMPPASPARCCGQQGFTGIAAMHSVAVFDSRSGAVHTIGPTASDRIKSPRNEPRNPPSLTTSQSTLHPHRGAW
jgi:hypothetical protein